MQEVTPDEASRQEIGPFFLPMSINGSLKVSPNANVRSELCTTEKCDILLSLHLIFCLNQYRALEVSILLENVANSPTARDCTSGLASAHIFVSYHS